MLDVTLKSEKHSMVFKTAGNVPITNQYPAKWLVEKVDGECSCGAKVSYRERTDDKADSERIQSALTQFRAVHAKERGSW